MTSHVLRHPDFRLLFFTRVFSGMGLQAQAVIVGWQIYQIRPDALLLGLIGLAEAIPAIGCAFFSGHLVDSHRPLWIYRWSLTVLLFNTCLLLFAAAPQSPLEANQRLILLFVGVFISGAARSFSGPSVFSLLPKTVPREELSAAIAWNTSTFQMAAIMGPAIGGLLYGTAGPIVAFAFPPTLVACALIFSMFFSRELAHTRNQSVREPFLQSLRAGIRFTLGHRVLLSTMLLDMFSVLFGGATAVLPIFADQILHTGSFGLGLLRAAPSVGSMLVAVWLAIRPMKKLSGLKFLWVVAAFGACMIGFALSTSFALSLLILAASGLFDGYSMVIRGTFLQILTPEKMRGRVSALGSIFITSSNEIGAFESGLAARLMTLVPSVVFGGVMSILVVVGVNWRVPELRKTVMTKDTALAA